MLTQPYIVQHDYRTDRLNGGGPAVWTEGDRIDLLDDDASWVNRDRPGTLELVVAPEDGVDAGESATAEDSQTSVVAEEVPATTPAAEQSGGKPRGRGRRTDSAG